MNVLVAYATKAGSTAQVAEWIAEEVRAEGHEATVTDLVEDPDPRDYDAVIVGSAIRGEKWLSHASDWVEGYRDALAERPFATFTMSLSVANGRESTRQKVTRYTTKMLDPLELEPRVHVCLAGAYDPQSVTAGERTMLMVIGMRNAVDHRDQDEVTAFTRQALEAFAQA